MATVRRAASAPPHRLILDSGAVIALSRHSARARSILQAAHEAGADVSVPSVVVTETLRGRASDTPVNIVLKAIGAVDDADEPTAREAGHLLGSARSDSTIDAIVVATAVRHGGALILTGDPHDLTRLAADHPEVVIQTGL